jgi:microcystin-dependent protein
MAIIDQHNHAPGSGVQINPSGLLINSDLTFGNNNLTNVRSVRFQSQPSALDLPTDLGCIYESGVDLWYNDGNGNQIKITAGGVVNATSSGISSGTASASFSSGVLVVNAAPNTPADIQVASVLLGNNVVNSKYLTLSPPPSMAANFTITLPTLPASTSLLTIDNSGNVAATTSPQSLVLPGFISMYGGSSAPVGYLLCDGTSYLQATYPNLFAAIGTAYGSVDGTHFNVPDLRGLFPRGVSGISGNDPDASSRTAQNTGGNAGNNVGSVQADAFASHNHLSNNTQEAGNIGSVFGGGNGVSTGSNAATTSTGGDETRPKNVYVTFVIKV